MPIVARPLAEHEWPTWHALGGPLARALQRDAAPSTPPTSREGCLLLWDGARAIARARLGHDSRLDYVLSFGLAPDAEALGPLAVRTTVEAARVGVPPRSVFAAYEEAYAPHFEAVGFSLVRRRIAMVARAAGWQSAAPGTLPPGVRLRRPRRAEAEAIGRMGYRAYLGGVDDNGETAQDLVDEIRAAFDGGLLLRLDASWIAWRGGEPLGASLIARFQGWPLVAHLVVAPEAQGQGLGRSLLLASLHDLAALDERDALLFVTLGNPAERLYRALGFTQLGPPQLNGLLEPTA